MIRVNTRDNATKFKTKTLKYGHALRELSRWLTAGFGSEGGWECYLSYTDLVRYVALIMQMVMVYSVDLLLRTLSLELGKEFQPCCDSHMLRGCMEQRITGRKAEHPLSGAWVDEGSQWPTNGSWLQSRHLTQRVY